eukprot:scaffold24159_cov117-Isochrysis_galbana.AAC.8
MVQVALLPSVCAALRACIRRGGGHAGYARYATAGWMGYGGSRQRVQHSCSRHHDSAALSMLCACGRPAVG